MRSRVLWPLMQLNVQMRPKVHTRMSTKPVASSRKSSTGRSCHEESEKISTKMMNKVKMREMTIRDFLKNVSRPCMASPLFVLIRQRRTRVNSPPLAAFHCLYRYPAALRRASSFALASISHCFFYFSFTPCVMSS